MWDYYIDIIKGVPKNYWGNAFIMQSDENLQNVIAKAKWYLQYENNRENAVDMALKMTNLNEVLDFTDLDRKRLRDWINGD